MIDSVPSIFHTSSLAEYHEYVLHLLLHNYANAFNISNATNEEDTILSEDVGFSKASQSYQYIVILLSS